MCQINNEDDSVLRTEESRPRMTKTCMKCEQPATVVARIQDPMCPDCFHIYFMHRFRATFGKSKAVRTGDKVLIAFSGGQSSCAMLHLVKEGLSKSVHKKLRYIPGVVFIDEGVCLNQGEEEHRKQLERIEVWLKESTFPAYMVALEEEKWLNAEETPLASDGDVKWQSQEQAEMEYTLALISSKGIVQEEKVMSDSAPDVRLVSGDQSCDMADESTRKVDHRCRERFLQLWNTTSTLTGKEDLLVTLRLKLLKQVAVKLGYCKVMLSDSGTRLAAGILSDLAKGRGATVYRGMSFLDDRDKDISILRPMREFTSREISLFTHQFGLQSVFIPRISTKAGPLSSINVLTEEFINRLQSNFPATVSTVMKTGSKLTSDDKADDASATCILCQSPLDPSPLPCSAMDATQYSQSLQRLAVPRKPEESGCSSSNPGANSCCGEGDGSCQSANKTAKLTSKDLSAVLCYGCRVMMRDVKNLQALPASTIAEINRQKRRAEMKSEIAEFLLEDDDDNKR